jgi:hypothetical protein
MKRRKRSRPPLVPAAASTLVGRRSTLALAAAVAGTAAGPSAAVPYEADYSGQIEVVARYDFPSHARHLDVEGRLAFVGTYDDGVLVFDLSVPEHPALVGSAPVPDVVNGVVGREDILYVAAHTSGVFVFDVSRPDDPVLLGSVDTPGYARRIALNPSTGPARFVYVAGDWRGIQVIDVGTPSVPRIVGELETESAYGVAYQAGLLYVADSAEGVLVVDVTDPANLQVVGVSDEPGAIEVRVVDTSLYVGGTDFFQVYDVSDPTDPRPQGRSVIGGYYGNGYAVGAVHVEGGVAHLAAQNQGLYLADVSNDENPVIFSGIRARYTMGVDRMGHWIVLSHFWGGVGSIQIVDARGRPSPAPVGFADHGGSYHGQQVMDVAVSEGYAYTVGPTLRVHDVTDATQPEILGELAIPYGGWEVAPAAFPYVVYVETTAGRLSVADVSDPTSPQLLGSIEPYEVYDLYGLDVVGRYAYVGARLRPSPVAGLVVMDLLDPAIPTVVTALPLMDGHAHHVEVSGNIAYVVTSGHLALVDVSTPTQPVLLSELEVGGGEDLRVVDGLAYLAIDYEGLKIADVSDPLAPVLLSSGVEGVYRAADVDVDGDFAYVSSLWWGVNVIDVSDPVAPVLLGATMVPPDQIGVSGTIEFANGLAYSGGNFGLAVLPRHEPSTGPALAAPEPHGNPGAFTEAHPNPFRSATTFAFRASGRGDARVAVYDVAGRLVRVLLNETVGSGRYVIRWDGRDGSGRASASGVYFVRLDVEDERTVRKIQRVR